MPPKQANPGVSHLSSKCSAGPAAHGGIPRDFPLKQPQGYHPKEHHQDKTHLGSIQASLGSLEAKPAEKCGSHLELALVYLHLAGVLLPFYRRFSSLGTR